MLTKNIIESKMRVLFLPENIASQQAILSDYLDKQENVESKFLVLDTHKYNSTGITQIRLFRPTKKNSFDIIYYVELLYFKKRLKKYLRWADVVHYVWDNLYEDLFDLNYVKKLKKPIFIEWVGSDIRDPEILSKINSFYKDALLNGYEYKDIESSGFNKIVQMKFSKFHAIPTIVPELLIYIEKTWFKEIVIFPQRINIIDFSPKYPCISNQKPIIVHAPSRKNAKGSYIISHIIDRLHNEIDFEFRLIHGYSREETLKKISEADIFLDQIIIGGYGMASCEAMAFGKPVIAFLHPDLYDQDFLQECPIVNANPDNLYNCLLELLKNPNLRQKVGKESRCFVEKYHDVKVVGANILSQYRKAINNI